MTQSEHFAGKYVGVDSALGRDKAFLDALPDNLICFADVPPNCEVFTSGPEMTVPEYSGRGKRPTQAVPSFARVSVQARCVDPVE